MRRSQTFSAGKGDVLLAYENEAIFAQNAGQPIEYVVPDQTILIENPAAVTVDASAGSGRLARVRPVAGRPARLRREGLPARRPGRRRRVRLSRSRPSLFTIADLGGWPDVRSKFFDRENGIVALIEQELGVPTDG